MAHLESQSVLITGCSTGIGRALATEFARRGHRTFATARRPETLDGLDGCEHLALDVTDPESIERCVAAVVEKAGRVDLLVNNAGFNVFGPVAEVPLADFRRLFDTNVTAVVAMVQAVFPHMARQRSGRVVNIGSVAGILPTPFAGSYCATKAAVHMLSHVLRLEVEPLGIDVVVVQPGGVRSSISATGAVGLDRYAEDGSYYRKVHDQILKRANASQKNPMEAEDFAQVVVEAVTRTRAPRIVRAGTGAFVYPRLPKLPSRVLDRILSKSFGLSALRE